MSTNETAGRASGMRHESVEQRRIRGRRSVLLMAINEEDIVYILTRADVEDIAKSIGIKKLIELHYQKAQEFFESFVDGIYNWTDAVSDGLRDAEEGLRGGYDDVSEKKKN